MAVSESARHELYATLEGLIGKEHVETLMALLPPVGWADVATKHDLAELEGRLTTRIDALEARLDGRFAAIDGKFEAIDARISARILRTALLVNIPTILGSFALAFTAVRLGA